MPFSRASRRRAAFGLLAVLALGACEESTPKPKPAPPDPPLRQEPLESQVATAHEQSLLALKDRCRLSHQGLVIDLGESPISARHKFRLTDAHPPEMTKRAGESFRRFDQMSTDFTFWLTEDLEDFTVRARVYGTSSERIGAYVDGKRLGSTSLKPDEAISVSISSRDLKLEPGRHELTLALSRPRGGAPGAEVGWVQIGPKQENPVTPATREESFSEVTIDERRLPGVVLRPLGSLRCPLWVPENATFETEVGVWGEGPAEAEIVVHTKTGDRVVVAADERKDDDPRGYKLITADLSQFGSQLIDLELSAPRTLKRARVVMGTPRLVLKARAKRKVAQARRAIVVVLSGLNEKHSPPAAAEHGFPFMNQLAGTGTTFTNYRASTTSVPGVLASLLTGVPPWVHQVEETINTLPTNLEPLASIVEAQGGRSAFFTGVPLTFAPLGLSRGFAKFEAIGPQEDRAATEPLTAAIKWLDSRLRHEGPVITFVHLRGGHPPFDVPREATVDLDPPEYGGDLTPRRAAIQLAEIRGRSSARNRQMPTEDWVRLEALQKVSLLKQSAELSALVAWLRKRDAWDDTLLIVMGDVGAESPPEIPFATNAPLVESALAAPLVIKFPKEYGRGTRPSGYFAPRDVSATIAQVLGLAPTTPSDAIDLSDESASQQALLRSHIAYRGGHYSLRLGSFLLIGEDGHAPLLCEPALDPTCQHDRSETQIMDARALWLEAFHTLSPGLAITQRKAVTDHEEPEGDEFFQNALTVWGVDR